MKLSLPPESHLHDWLKILAHSEVPVSYQLVCGLSVIGAAVGRQAYIDQFNWHVYPVLRVLLIGDTGIGKDTAIDQAIDSIRALGKPAVVGGRTYEQVIARIGAMEPPHEAVLPAYELTEFIGKQDYKEGIIQGLTNILSDKKLVDASIKSEKQNPNILIEPTITMLAGSTPDWLIKATPEGALEGGFFPRFLVIPETYTPRHVPLPKREMDKELQDEITRAKANWQTWLSSLYAKTKRPKRPKDIRIDSDAAARYTTWYYNRRKYFPVSVRPYAERSRDQVLRLAMLHAMSCDRFFVNIRDVEFGIMILAHVSQRIANVMVPSTPEALAAEDIREMLPATKAQILQALVRKHSRQRLDAAIRNLLDANEIIRGDNQRFEIAPLAKAN